MAKPSRILKNAWLRAAKPWSLKKFARKTIANGRTDLLGRCASLWFENKANTRTNKSAS